MSLDCPIGPADRPELFHLGYRRWLDGLRGVAILVVLGGHLRLWPGGFLGVDVFFVLSGFLITSLLAEEWQHRRSIALGRFYLRRALRLGPVLFTVLLALGLYAVVLRPAEAGSRLREVAVAGSYVANWPRLHRTDMPRLGHTWSLAVEEQFYLLWPMILYGLLRSGMGRGRVLLLVGAGILASAGLRAALLHRDPTPMTIWRLYEGLDTRADALLVGCLVGLLAAWGRLPKSRRFRYGARVAGLVSVAAMGYLIGFAHHDEPRTYYGLLTVAALLTGSVLVRLLLAPCRLLSPVLESGVLVGVGRISYSLYLVHAPVIHWMAPTRLGWSAPVATLKVTGLSFVVAVVCYHSIERPFLRLKGRLRPRETALSVRDAPQARVVRIAA